MKVIMIIDKFLDDREFRNYSASWLMKLGFTDIEIEDARIADDDPINDNDFFAKKKRKNYTVQTFLNREITKKEVEETLEDMKKENIANGLIVTNKEVSPEFREYAKEKSIEIIDRSEFTEEI